MDFVKSSLYVYEKISMMEHVNFTSLIFWIRNLIISYVKRTQDTARETESEIRSERRDLEERRVWSRYK